MQLFNNVIFFIFYVLNTILNNNAILFATIDVSSKQQNIKEDLIIERITK